MHMFLWETEWLNFSKFISELSHSKTMRCIDNRKCNCHRLVKQLTKGSHNQCNTTKKAFLVKGELLNAYFKAEEFDMSEEHQVCSNVADRIQQIQATKVSGRKRAPSVVLDAQKRHSNRLKDPGSLKVGDINNIVVSCTDDKKRKYATTIIFLSREQGQELDIGQHSPLAYCKQVKSLEKLMMSSQQKKERGGLLVTQRNCWQVVWTRNFFARWGWSTLWGTRSWQFWH